MYRTKNRCFNVQSRILDKNGNPILDKPIDQFNSHPFNFGANGLPANDITLLARATTQKEYDMILARLKELKVDNPDNTNKSDRQIVSEIMPSWVQSPAEIEGFMDWYSHVNTSADKLNIDKITSEKVSEKSVESVETPSET